mgnify:CR=1 FL=1
MLHIVYHVLLNSLIKKGYIEKRAEKTNLEIEIMKGLNKEEESKS